MRLIDADKLLKVLHITDNDNRAQCIDLCKLKKVIESQPNAYDVDAVVEQLETAKTSISLNDDELLIYRNALDDAIEIVKGGGVDGN